MDAWSPGCLLRRALSVRPFALLPLVGALFAGCGGSSAEGAGGRPLLPPPATCNGHAELCDRPYDQVAYAGTHGSYTNVDEGFGAPDQTHDVARQLADGVRVLHFEIHVDEDKVVVCHGLCLIGEKPLVDDFAAVHRFIAENPDNVVTLLLERSDDVVTADQIGQAFALSGLSGDARVQRSGEPWPTLADLIRHHQQVIAFLDDTSGSHEDFLLPRWSFTWETPWDNEKPADFGRCDADRGTQGNDLYVVDTYLEDELIPTADHAALVNHDPFLIDRLLYCRKATNTMPNFVMVNYYEVGDVFTVVDVLNGLAPEPNDDLAAFPPAAFGAGGAGGATATGAGGG
jgi:hypothetical protein